MRLFRPVRLSIVGVLVSTLSCAFAASASAQGEKKQPAKMEEAQRVEAQALIALVDEFANGKPPANPLPVRGIPEVENSVVTNGERGLDRM